MTPGDVAVLLAAAGGLSGLAALIRVLIDRRQGIASAEHTARAEEREDRRDTIADRDGLLDRLLEDVQGYRAEARDTWTEMRDLRERIESLEESRRSLEAHVYTLEDHIWRQLPPPPPPRPGG